MSDSGSYQPRPVTTPKSAVGKQRSPLDFEAPRGHRCHRYGVGVTVMGGRSVWWCNARRQWIDAGDVSSCVDGYSSHATPVRTLKAFRRHLRRHAAELAGCRVIWVNRFVGHDVSAALSGCEGHGTEQSSGDGQASGMNPK